MSDKKDSLSLNLRRVRKSIRTGVDTGKAALALDDLPPSGGDAPSPPKPKCKYNSYYGC